MYKKTLVFSAALLLSGMAAGSTQAQVTTTTTKTEVVQHADGSYSVIEYPVGKEVMVNLTPNGTLVGSKGMAHVMRTADGTKVIVDLNGVTGDMSNVYAYAVDPSGATTLLGPVAINSGTGRAEFMTPMNQFMLLLSPNEGLTTYDSSTTYVYRSEAPKGYAIVPRRVTSMGGTKSVARAESVGSTYDVPLLGIPKWNGKTNEVRIKFDGELSGLDGKAYLKPEGTKTQIKMRFSDMNKVPANKRLVLWASSPDGSYTKIGQVIHAGGKRDEAEIRGEVALTDFGLFMTAEDVDVTVPTSRIYSTFRMP